MYYKNRESIPGIDWSSSDNGGVFIEDVDKEILANAGNYTIKNKKIVLLKESEWFNESKEKIKAEALAELAQIDNQKARPISTILDTIVDVISRVENDPVLMLSQLTSIMAEYPDDVNKIKELEARSKELRELLK